MWKPCASKLFQKQKNSEKEKILVQPRFPYPGSSHRWNPLQHAKPVHYPQWGVCACDRVYLSHYHCEVTTWHVSTNFFFVCCFWTSKRGSDKTTSHDVWNIQRLQFHIIFMHCITFISCIVVLCEKIAEWLKYGTIIILANIDNAIIKHDYWMNEWKNRFSWILNGQFVTFYIEKIIHYIQALDKHSVHTILIKLINAR